ncbi:MAG: restriction endonuclease subunit S [Bacilli bacterium]|nr:restriction endonuclease subunit S [Bacilli bacterium]
MNKIKKLIKEMCPNGVEYKALGQCVKSLKKGTLKTSELVETGYPVINSGRKLYGYYNNFNNIGPSLTIAARGEYAGFINFFNQKFWAGGLCYPYKSLNEENLSTKFIYYFLKNIEKNIRKEIVFDGSIPALNKQDIEKVKIPIPPIEVQKEIVKILDKFSELEEELEEELEARKKQYEFYNGFLFEISKRKKYVKFGNVANIVRGASPRPIKNFITSEKNGYPWIKIGDVSPNDKFITKTKEMITYDGVKKSRIVRKGDFILSNSMSFGRPYILGINGCIHDGWLSISDFEKTFTNNFLYYLLNSEYVQNLFKQKVSSGTVQNLNADIVKSIELPVYTFEEQERIVSILDKFDKLVNDMKEGLPAEIEFRRKQYEYYRNKLLSFKELS